MYASFAPVPNHRRRERLEDREPEHDPRAEERDVLERVQGARVDGALVETGRCQRTRFAAQIGKATNGFARTRRRITPGSARIGRRSGPGEPGEEAERREIAEEQVLRHVEREELLLADLRDRRRDGEDEEGDAEREECDAPAGTGWPRRASVRARRA